MAQERPVTPEKQLLTLIENRKAKGADVQAQVLKHRGESLLSQAAWRGRIAFFKDSIKRWRSRGSGLELDVKLVNNILVLCIAALCAYLIMNIYTSIMVLKKGPLVAFTAREVSVQLKEAKDITRMTESPSYYREKLSERDIFKLGPKAPPPKAEEFFKPPTSKIVEMTANLRLVGISWSNDPDAMIEDTKAIKTFFVKRGSMIGDVKVQAIFKDKIILSYHGEECELK